MEDQMGEGVSVRALAHPFHPGGARGGTRGRAGMEMMRALVARGELSIDRLEDLLQDAQATKLAAIKMGNGRLLLSALRLIESCEGRLLDAGAKAAKDLETFERADAGERTGNEAGVTIIVQEATP